MNSSFHTPLALAWHPATGFITREKGSCRPRSTDLAVLGTRAGQALGESRAGRALALEPSGALSCHWSSPELPALGNRVTELRKSALISERIETWHSERWVSREAWRRAKTRRTDVGSLGPLNRPTSGYTGKYI